MELKNYIFENVKNLGNLSSYILNNEKIYFSEKSENILNRKIYNLEDFLKNGINREFEKFLSNLENKEVFFSDLDNTLLKSKYDINENMVSEIVNLLERKELVIVTGGLFETVYKNFISHLPEGTNFQNLKILPLLGNEIFEYDEENKSYTKINEIEESIISGEEAEFLKNIIFKSLKEFGHPNEITDYPISLSYEDITEGRGTDSIKTLSFAYFGQCVPKQLGDYKENWDKPPYEKRKKLIEIIKSNLPKEYLEKFSFEIGGSTTIDVTKKGFDKSKGIKNYLDYGKKSKNLENYCYFGDSFSKDGNDYSVYKMGIKSIDVKNEDNSLKLFNYLNLRNYNLRNFD